MIQAAIGAAIKEILGGLVDELPKPPVGGEIRVAVVLEIRDGKPVLKEGSEISIDLHLSLGEE